MRTSHDAGYALDLASALIRSHDGPGMAVLFSDIAMLPDGQGKTWGDLGIDYEQVIDTLLDAPVPLLYLTLSQVAHTILCDASREGVRIYYQDGQVEHMTSEMRRDVHTALAATLESDWQPYIQGSIDRGAIQAQ